MFFALIQRHKRGQICLKASSQFRVLPVITKTLLSTLRLQNMGIINEIKQVRLNGAHPKGQQRYTPFSLSRTKYHTQHPLSHTIHHGISSIIWQLGRSHVGLASNGQPVFVCHLSTIPSYHHYYYYHYQGKCPRLGVVDVGAKPRAVSRPQLPQRRTW